jgi:hypothetical protein
MRRLLMWIAVLALGPSALIQAHRTALADGFGCSAEQEE